MKTAYTLLAVLAICSTTALAQPTFTGATLQPLIGQNIKLTYSTYVGTTAAPISAPPIGNGTAFDFRGYAWSAPSSDTIVAIPNSALATHYETGYGDAVSATKGLASYSLLTKLDATGMRQVGWAINADVISLTATTGGANDNIIIPAQNIALSKPIFTQRYPMTVGTVINDAANTRVRYTGSISVAAYGLNNAPFTRVLYISQRDSVVGWGTVDTYNENANAITTPVLQVRRVTVRVDSFFLAGAPAPAAILAGLGTSQGRISSSSRNLFVSENSAYPLTYTYSANATFTAPTNAYMLVLPEVVGTATAKKTATDWSFYPNPVSGSAITLHYTTTTPIQLQLTDRLGRIVHTQVLPANPSGEATTLQLPIPLEKGIYALSLISETNAYPTQQISILE